MAQAYGAVLGGGWRLTLATLGTGERTSVTLSQTASGSQQQQTVMVQTGPWRSPPDLFCLADQHYGLRIQGRDREVWLDCRPGQLHQCPQPPLLLGAIAVPLTPEAPPDPAPPLEPMRPMEPMKPLPPMKMGNMTMDLNAMTMNIGDQTLSFSNQSGQPGDRAAQPPNTRPNFCPQCGHRLESRDRFCSQCGTALN
ncbi:MAG: hypothetical protein Fur0042_09960 [Cyanophyceae cyanobacterium]